MFAQRYIHEYGATSEDFGRIAVADRKHAAKNPKAWFYEQPITLEDHQSSRWIVEPLHLLDCCQESDGAQAIVVTTPERARDLAQPPVIVNSAAQGVAENQDMMTSYYRESITGLPEMGLVARQLWDTTGLAPDDIETAVIYDHFTPFGLPQLEEFGFCARGEAKDFIRRRQHRARRAAADQHQRRPARRGLHPRHERHRGRRPPRPPHLHEPARRRRARPGDRGDDGPHQRAAPRRRVSANPLGTPGTGVVVTGGASGIGAGICAALAEVGRPVAVWDRDADGATRVAAQCRDEHGVATHAVGVDVTDDDTLADAVAPTVATLGPVGGLVHGAGIVAAALDDVIDVTTWDAVLATHLHAYTFAVRALLPELRAAGAGSTVVGISSIEGLIGHGAIPSYTAAKHGIIGLTRSFAHRLGPEGVHVNAVCPGYIDTPMLAPALASPDSRAELESHIPLGRLGAPRDIARVARFLLSDESAYMNGAAVVVDGGVTATGGQ